MEEQTNNRHQSHSTPRKAKNTPKILLLGAVIVVVAGLGFMSGIQYQKGKTPKATASNQQTNGYGMGGTNGGFGGGRRMYMGDFGTVTAVSSTSISVKSDRTGEIKTYTISSSTTFTKDSTSATASDIAVGNTVIVEPSSSDTSVAGNIVINPSMNGTMNSSDTSTQTN